MENAALAEQAEAKEHLLGVRSYCLEVDSHIAAEFLEDLAKIDAGSWSDGGLC